MAPQHRISRRDLLKSAGAAALGLPLLAGRLSSADAPQPATAAAGTALADRVAGVKLGVATISLRDLSIAAAAQVMKQLEVEYASVFRTHAAFEQGTAEECRNAAQAFRDGGVTPITTSVVNLRNDEAALRRAFDNVRAAGLSLMTCKPAPDALPAVEKFVKEYDIRLAIHNHGPEDKEYPSPLDAMKLIEGLDSRIGLCVDIGHTMRAGVDPVEVIRQCAARVYDVHLKDSLAVPGARDIPTEVGRGRIDIRGILAALLEIKYSGVVAFEYERMGVNAALGVAESVGFVRGVLAGLTA